ncbi:MAG: formylglycine-generating enzyme family protein [Thermosynechococcaceae cyanobacterium]
MPSIAVFHQPSTCRGFIQKLDEHCSLEMVEIPAGSFMMGSPDQEIGNEANEKPQHEVNIQRFCMGRYPVTQAQWRFVAGLTPDLNPEPSRFKGDDRPVERVSWLDAVKFCQHLSAYSGRDYRLPSEAEWEYACRAGTTTPFHFGETITPDLANYDWSRAYIESQEINLKQGSKGTTPVGHFGVANAFGLFDMHGNVWEWCEDHWHNAYREDVPDGHAWLDNANQSDRTARRLLRGGSWSYYPRNCRSARRFNGNAGVENFYGIGFRVVCSAARTS